MPYASFLAAVRDRGGYGAEEAETITEAVVSALGHRLTAEAAEHLADQLPPPLAEVLNDSPAPAHNWGVHEFVARVAESSGVDEASAENHARDVLSTMAEQVSGGEINKLLSRLPAGYAAFFGHPELTT